MRSAATPERVRVVYVEGLEETMEASGIALPWLNEIHIDKKHENTKLGQAILEHEVHHVLLLRQKRGASWSTSLKLLLWNNIWDFLSQIKLYYTCKMWRVLAAYIIYFAAMTAVFVLIVRYLIPILRT